MKHPKTKKMVDFLEALQLNDRRILMVGSEETAGQVNLMKSLRNIPKKEFLPLPQINGYEIVRSQEIVVLESALDELISLLG